MRHLLPLAAAGVMAVASTAWAADPGRQTRAISLVPDGEQRSRIVEVMVNAPAAGKSKHEVSDDGLQLAVDATLALAAQQNPGVAPGELVVQALEYREFPVSNGALPVTLRAEVRAPAKAAPAAQVMVDQKSGEVVSGAVFSPEQLAAGAPLEVHVWTQRKEFAAGDEMVIRIRGNRDFYGRLIYRDVEGHIMQILPNVYRNDTVFKADTDYVVPGPGDKFTLRVAPPFGEEAIVLMASTKPLGEVPAADAGNGVLVFNSNMDQVSGKTRALKMEPTPASAPGKPAEPAGAEFIEHTWKVTTRPR